MRYKLYARSVRGLIQYAPVPFNSMAEVKTHLSERMLGWIEYRNEAEMIDAIAFLKYADDNTMAVNDLIVLAVVKTDTQSVVILLERIS